MGRPWDVRRRMNRVLARFDVFRADIQEIFGMHYELPELGPLGASGLANPRDFEHPIAHFDVDQTNWEGAPLPLSPPSSD